MLVPLDITAQHASPAAELVVSRYPFLTLVAQMPKMTLSPDRLSLLLEPQGFWLRDVDSVTKTIAFVRQSTIPRLYEHLNVYGQGKVGEAVYATTAISGSTSHSCDECISEEDLTLLYTLETDKDRHWTLVRTKEEAEIWESRVAQVADFQCRATGHSKGPLLHERLQPAFSAVDRYIGKLGNVNDVFASEYRYSQQAPAVQRSEAERLASLIGYIGESSEDIQLACLVLFLFAPEVEGREDAFRGKKWHEDPSLRVRIYLLIDFIRAKRKLFAAANEGRG
jgi:hypothetical protein